MKEAWIYGCGTCGRDIFLKADLSIESRVPDDSASHQPEPAAEPCESCRAVIAQGDTGAFPEMTLQSAHSVSVSGRGNLVTECLNPLMGWCECGNPGDMTAVIMQYLRITGSDQVFDDKDEAKRALWMLLGYIADYLEWTDHGGSVSRAWLTDTGKEALRRYDEGINTG